MNATGVDARDSPQDSRAVPPGEHAPPGEDVPNLPLLPAQPCIPEIPVPETRSLASVWGNDDDTSRAGDEAHADAIRSIDFSAPAVSALVNSGHQDIQPVSDATALPRSRHVPASRLTQASSWANDDEDEAHAQWSMPALRRSCRGAPRRKGSDDNAGAIDGVAHASQGGSASAPSAFVWDDDGDEITGRSIDVAHTPPHASGASESSEARTGSERRQGERARSSAQLHQERPALASWGSDEEDAFPLHRMASSPLRVPEGWVAAITSQVSRSGSAQSGDGVHSAEVSFIPERPRLSDVTSPLAGSRLSAWADEDQDASNDGQDFAVEAGDEPRDRSSSRDFLFFEGATPRPAIGDLVLAALGLAERDEGFGSTFPRRSATPSTAAPSPFSKTTGRHDCDDHDVDEFEGAFPVPSGLGRAHNKPARIRTSSAADRSPLHNINSEDVGSARGKEKEIAWLPLWGKGVSDEAQLPKRGAMLSTRRLWQRGIGRVLAAGRGRGEGGSGQDSLCESGGKGADARASGVRAWTWVDNLRKAPGLLARLGACTLAVCALWMTSLSVAVDMTGGALPSPTLNDVVGAAVHAYRTLEEQRSAYRKCVEYQSQFCDADMTAFEASARQDSSAALASTSAILERARLWTESCNASVSEAIISLKTWLAQGSGHVVSYTDRCEASDEALVADYLGDTSAEREALSSANERFVGESADAVSALSSYALARSAYDASYVANQSSVVSFDPVYLIENLTLEVSPRFVNSTLETIVSHADVLVACVSLSGDSGGLCPGVNARALVDNAWAKLDGQLSLARAGFQSYADALERYVEGVELAYGNAETFYNGVMQYFARIEVNVAELDSWSALTLSSFKAPATSFPSGDGILSGYEDVPTAAQMWREVRGAQDEFRDRVLEASANMSAQIMGMAHSWQGTAEAALADANITFAFEVDDYDPPRYGNASDGEESDSLLFQKNITFRSTADAFAAKALAFLDALGPSAPNRSFPLSPPLNYTLSVGGASSVVSSPIEYTFASFASVNVDFGSWVLSVANLGVLLLAADYLFRCSSSIRLFIRFWGRGGLGMPDADLRAGNTVLGTRGIAGRLGKAAARVLLHPATVVLFFSIVGALLLRNLASIYVPLFEDYRAGCVVRSQDGSFFSQNAYSVAYNYASESGNRRLWNYQEDHTSRRAALCVELTASTRQFLAETDLQLRNMYEAHHDDVTLARMLETCVDTAAVDAQFAQACCGLNGYHDSCAKNSILSCPMTYASGRGEPCEPVTIALSNEACAEDTTETAKWKIDDGIYQDCDAIPACHMTCSGPNKELLRAVIVHAGCMMEWLLHASLLKGFATTIVFIFLNLSRLVIVGGLMKLNWRHMHTGIFTYRGTCTRTGELVVVRPEEKMAKSEEAAAATHPARGFSHRKWLVLKKCMRKTFLRYRRRARGAGSAADSAEVGENKASTATPSTGPAKAPVTFKGVIAGAVEEGLQKFERGARRRVALGMLLNVPWVLVLWCISGGRAVYDPA